MTLPDAATTTVSIRAFAAADAAVVNRVAVAAFEEFRHVFADWRDAGPRFAATASHAGEVDLLVAEETGEIRGFVGYDAPGRPRERIFKRRWATLRMLAVDPVARGRGIGRQLTEECIRRARQDGAPMIALHTSPVMAAAVALYLRLGFTRSRAVVDRYGIHYDVYTLDLCR